MAHARIAVRHAIAVLVVGGVCARALVPQGVVCAANNTVLLDDTLYCKLRFMPKDSEMPSVRISPATPGLSPLYRATATCVRSRFQSKLCSETEELLISDDDDHVHFACTCLEGWYRPRAGKSCKLCLPTRPVCPRYTDTAYVCPRGLYRSGNTCLSTRDYSAIPAVCSTQGCAAALVYHPHAMRAVRIPPCPATKERSARGLGCECRRGYYTTDINSTTSECEPCARGLVCTGRMAMPENCTDPALETPFIAAGEQQACVQKQLGAVRRCMRGRLWVSSLGACVACPLDHYCPDDDGGGSEKVRCPLGAVTLRMGAEDVGGCLCAAGGVRVDRDSVPNMRGMFACRSAPGVLELSGAPVLVQKALAFEREAVVMAWTPASKSEGAGLLGAVVSFYTATRRFVLVLCALSGTGATHTCSSAVSPATTDVLFVPFRIASFVVRPLHRHGTYRAAMYCVYSSGTVVFRYEFSVEYVAPSGGLVMVAGSGRYMTLAPTLTVGLPYTVAPLMSAGVLVVAGKVRVARDIPSGGRGPVYNMSLFNQTEFLAAMRRMDTANTAQADSDSDSDSDLDGGTENSNSANPSTTGAVAHHVVYCVATDTNTATAAFTSLFNSSESAKVDVALLRNGLCANVSAGHRSALVLLHACRVVAPEACGESDDLAVSPLRVTLEHHGARFSADIASVQHAGPFFVVSEQDGLAAFWVAPGLAVSEQDAPAALVLADTCASDSACVGVLRQRGLCPPGYEKLNRLESANATGAGGVRCVLCQSNSFCVDGVGRACPANSTVHAAGGSSVLDCVCIHGFFMHEGRGCRPCPLGLYCPYEGGVRACPRFSRTRTTESSAALECLCDAGYFRQGPNTEDTPSTQKRGVCRQTKSGSYSPALNDTVFTCAADRVSAAGAAECVCRAGMYMSGGACEGCGAGVACPEGSSSPGNSCDPLRLETLSRNLSACVCEPGNHNVSITHAGSTHAWECGVCPAGYYCNAGSGVAMHKCPYEQTSPFGSAHAHDCICERTHFTKIAKSDVCVCTADYYANNSHCVPCPPHSSTRGVVAAASASKCVCDDGFSADAAAGGACVSCAVGHYCQSGIRKQCVAGTFGPAVRQSSQHACVPCPGPEPASRPGSSHPGDCAGELLVFRLGERYESIFAPSVHTEVRAEFFATAQQQRALRKNMVASFENVVDTVAVHVDIQVRFDMFTVATLNTTPEALEHIVTKLALDTETWTQIRTLTLVHANAYELAAHAVVCELVVATLVAELKTAASNARGQCVTRGVAVPDTADARAVRALAHAFVARGIPTYAATTTDVEPWPWKMDAALAEILNIVAQNLKYASLGRHWPDAAALLNRTAVFAGAARGTLVLLTPPAGGSGLLALDADYLRVSGELANGACTPAVAAVSGACASLQRTEGARCVFCRGGVEYLKGSAGGQCAPCTKRTCSTGTLEPCCRARDAECVRPQKKVTECGNFAHDIFEACDKSAGTPLSACCTDDCTRFDGYYAVPACATHCGDGIVAAPREQCEPSLVNQSNPQTRKCGFDCQWLSP